MLTPAERFDLAGRVAVVTGATRGLGRAIAAGLAGAGASVVVVSRKPDQCRDAAARLERESGRPALACPADVGRWDSLPAIVDAAYERFGRLDVLVNNAGMSPLYPDLASVEERLFDKVIAVNLKAPFRLSVLAASLMAKAGGGSIVNISSTVSGRPRAEVVPYAAAKAGLNNLTASLAHAFGPSVRCNAVVCGTFHTDATAGWDPDAFARRSAGFALGRGGRPEEVVGAVLYLASDASSYTTGATVTVDGGQP